MRADGRDSASLRTVPIFQKTCKVRRAFGTAKVGTTQSRNYGNEETQTAADTARTAADNFGNQTKSQFPLDGKLILK
jgi:hypothetical protein